MSLLTIKNAQDIEHANLDPYTRAVNRLTWWAVLAHDRMLSLGTGRPVTIKSKEISVRIAYLQRDGRLS